MKQHRSVILVLAVAALLAALVVVACDRWVPRGVVHDPNDELCMSYVSLCGLMGLPVVSHATDVTQWGPPTKRQMAFCRRMAELSAPLVPDDGQRYEVWAVSFDAPAHGWPFITSGRKARVLINRLSDWYQVAEFWVEEPRNTQDRWLSSLGNWAFYFVAILPLVFGGSWAFHWLRRRFGQRVRAFPVVVVEEGHG